MMPKIRAPRLRSVLIGMVITAGLLLLFMHRQAQLEMSRSKTTGLAAVAGGFDPISNWSHSNGTVGRLARVADGIVGGVPADQAAPAARPQLLTYLAAEAGGGGGGGDTDKLEKKLIRTVTLELIVKDARAASLQVQQIAHHSQGEVERADLRSIGDSSKSGEVALRVPADQLEVIVEQLRKLSIHIQNEHWESKDITRAFMDSEARLRNMKAEEQQYLVLLKRAVSMKDTLEVTEKLTEVRGEIEQLQGELNWWSHQVAMSAIQVSLNEELQAVVAARWRPLYNAKNAAHDMLLGLGEWIDWAVAFIINIPLILLWVCSIGGLLWAGWRILRWVWVRWLKPSPQIPVAASTP